MTADKQDPSRAAFEAWAETVDIDTSKWFDYPDIYRFKSAETSWVAWQASREQALEEAAQACIEQQQEPECPERAAYCAEAIRSLK